MQGGQEELLTAAPALLADVLRRFGEARVRATGGSMFPTVRTGDVLTVRRCPPHALANGDIILVIEDDRLYAHRLVAASHVDDELRLVTRGDSHGHRDPARPVSALLGRVVAVTRGGRVRREPFPCSLWDRLRGRIATEWVRLCAHVRRAAAT